MIMPKHMEEFTNNQVVAMYEKLNIQLSKTIVTKLKDLGDISSFTRSQIRTLQLQGGHDVFFEALNKTNGLTAQRKREIVKLYNEIADQEMKGYSYVYKLKGLDYKLSGEAIQMLNAAKTMTDNEIRNLTGSIAYATQNEFIEAVDDLYKKVATGSFSYDRAMKDTVNDLTEKGVTLINSAGHKEKLEVAVRRNMLTSIHQTAQYLAEDVGNIIGANCVVIGHSDKCRPSHNPIDAVTMSLDEFKANYEYLTQEPNCNHVVNYDWQPEFEKAKHKIIPSEEHQSLWKTKRNYDIQQKARYYERQVREKKRKIVSGNDDEKTRKQLRLAQAKLRVFNKANNLEQDYLRTWTPVYNK